MEFIDLILRPETAADAGAITRVHDLAFARPAEGRLVEKLRRRPGFDPALSVVAVHNGKIVGHILFTPVAIVAEGEETTALALAPMAVLPEYQRRGIGSRLVRSGLAAARAQGYSVVIVLGHAEYYPRFGFQPASRWQIHAPFAVPDEAFMALALRPGALEGVRGVVTYPEVFLEE